MQFHLYIKNAAGTWVNEDTAMLATFGIVVGLFDGKERAAEITYEHVYDEALAQSAVGSVGQTQVRDDAGSVLVEFNRGHMLTNHIGW